MPLSLATVAQTPDQAILKAGGHLAKDSVLVLDAELARLTADASRVVLDLRAVRRIDRAGVALLRRWALPQPPDSRRVPVHLSLRDGSRFLRVLLESRGIEVR